MARQRTVRAAALPALHAEALALIDPAQGPLQAPVRAQLFGAERFRQHGQSLAQAQRIERRGWRRRAHAPPFFPRIADNLRSLDRSLAYLELLDRETEGLSPAAEWLLDNFHLIEAQVPEIRNGLPRSYYGRLPKLREPPLRGLPRVYGIAWAFVAHTDASFDALLLEQFLCAYQQHEPLTLGELWAIPATLRVVLLENLARLAESVAGHKAAQAAADWTCDHAAELPAGAMQALATRLRARGLQTSFVAQLVQRARGHAGLEDAPSLDWLCESCTDLDAALAAAQELHAADNVSVSNAVSALHAINSLDWRALVTRVSPVLQALQQQPAFRADSDLTRDHCTHELERLARRLRRSELELSRQVLRLCETDGEADGDGRGPSHWLIGAGRAELVRALGRSLATLENPLLQWPWRLRGPLYALTLLGGSLLLARALLGPPLAQPGPPWLGWLAWALAAFVGFEAVLALLNRCLAESLRVHRLPRLALDEGLRSQDRCLLVIPCMLGSAKAVAALAEQLEQHYLANPEAHVRFALLSDWPDAPQQEQAGDAALLESACAAMRTLNRRYPLPAEAPPRFGLLHRARRWNPAEQVWMGWERKRGKLEQLLAALVDADRGGESASPFLDLGALSQLAPATRYLITLDSDTGLPPGTLRELVAVAAHPLNQPRLDAQGRRVVAGYGILQPGLVAPLPRPGALSLFAWLQAGPWGLDVYNAGSSEIHQDLFGLGSFNGKGLLHVRAMHLALQGRVTENQLLSHDLFEGIWARAAHLSDLSLVEAHPAHPDVAASRQHRWTRGDWQLLPLIGSVLRGRVGLLNLWKLLDNLRRSLLAPACWLLLWLACGAAVLAPAQAIGLVLAALGLGPLLGALAALLPGRRDLALMHLLLEGLHELAHVLASTLWQFAMLPQAAALQLDAILRALWRSLVSRRHMLQWTTAAQAQSEAWSDWAGCWRRHLGLSLLALAWAGSAALWPDAHRGWLLGLGLLWCAAPLWLWLASRPLPAAPADGGLSPAQHRYLWQLARDTWRFFEVTVSAADHHLPPDNLQLEPDTMLARRTSPTNIGLYLASCACAERLGFIDAAELVQRLQATLDSLAKLPRVHGHFHNWIDTASLQSLRPHYVSTVDSGNLAALLWATAQACRACAERLPGGAADPLGPPLQALAERMDGLSAEMEFGFLYDRRRRLFRIGFRPDEAALDPAYYDLLASESRLGSFVAIAKGDVPRSHWQALGRPFLPVGREPTLRSWSGSMFEYLMPGLLMHEPRGGLLQRVGATALRAQRAFGARHRMPWGVSECAYYEQDASLAFQYGPFGVPQLAMRRTPLDERVIAPYASLLALPIDAGAALANLQALERLGARGTYGFIEALDFSAARRSEGAKPQRVATHMSHHQGMGLLALCHLLCEAAPQAWFGRAPRARAHEILLHERMPRAIVLQSLAIPRTPHQPQAGPALGAARSIDPAAGASTAMPTLLLGNGSYNLCLRPNGAGQSRWRGQAINRGRDDALRDSLGQWLLLRHLDEPGFSFHSLTQAPVPHPQAQYQTRFFADHAEFDASCAQWESRLSVWVSPDDDVELRSLDLHNLGDAPAEFELLSYFEVALTAQRADESHPAFAKLFVRAHAAEPACLLLERRPRLESESGVWLAHFLASELGTTEPNGGAEGGSDGTASVSLQQVSCDRARLLPRGGTLAQLGSATEQGAEDSTETGLDPAASLRLRVRLPAHARHTLTFATAAAADAAGVLAIVDEYRQAVHLTRARLMAATLARIRQRELRLSGAELQLLQDLNTPMTLSCARPQATPEGLLDRRELWRFAISGDRPIALLRVDSLQGMRVARLLMTAHRLWDLHGLCCDLVLLNGEPASYLQPLQRQLQALQHNVGLEPHAQQAERGAIYLLQLDQLTPSELAVLRASARIELRADGRALARLLADARVQLDRPADAQRLPSPAPAWPLLRRPGRFNADGSAFEFEVDAEQLPPRPWCNVLANAQFGCVLSETGGGYSWARNSRLHQLTPWSNDALLDPPGEHWLLRDEASGQNYGLMPGIDRNGSAGYRIAHRPGSSHFVQQRGGLHIHTEVMVHPSLAAKCIQVRLRCSGAAPQRLGLLAMVEWVMGAQTRDRMSLRTEHLDLPPLLLAQQLERGGGFGGGCAYLMLIGAPVLDWSCARDEFFADDGTQQWPQTLGQQQGFGLDPCAAIATQLSLAPGQSLSCSWVLGYGEQREAALAQAARLSAPGELEAWAASVDAHWQALLSAVTVQTPDAGFDALFNHWLLYQTLACRLWAKAGFYQASGATGFRDQLQDAMALGVARPALLRQQLLLHASRQFPEGDVQHWWHEPGGAGVRTRFSDDLLWLPYALQHYLRLSADDALLDEELPFLAGPPVPEHAEDAYYTPATGALTASLYEHAARAIDHSLRWGAHGLPLMGCGDWNDGMNRVGHEGRGESVWLAWFELVILEDWLTLARQRRDDARAARWQAAIGTLQQALAEHGWDGAWYRRAYFDNGHALGASANAECRIDLIAQTWSVFASPAGDARAAQAMQSADALLVDRQQGLIRLLDPPLQQAPDHAGYIQAYPPGVRENGGQYSHAAAWAVLAQARLGHAELAWAYFRMLSPAHRAADLAGQRRYGIEPYVMPGDTYSAPPYQGRGGWSWYTGSAAWMYRAALEGLLGLRLEAQRFSLQPCIPPEWPELRIQVRRAGLQFELLLLRRRGAGPEPAASASARPIEAGEWLAYADLLPGQLLCLALPPAALRPAP